MRYFGKVKILGFYLWNSNHMIIHLLLGVLYAWFLREVWQQLSIWYTLLSVIGSLIIDIDHFIYVFFYGRHEWYAKEVKKFLRGGQIRQLWMFWKYNHKNNTGLASHNIYFLGGFFLLSILSYARDSKTGVVIFGAIVLHLIFDAFDDLWVLGRFNKSWKRLRRRPSPPPEYLYNAEK